MATTHFIKKKISPIGKTNVIYEFICLLGERLSHLKQFSYSGPTPTTISLLLNSPIREQLEIILIKTYYLKFQDAKFLFLLYKTSKKKKLRSLKALSIKSRKLILHKIFFGQKQGILNVIYNYNSTLSHNCCIMSSGISLANIIFIWIMTNAHHQPMLQWPTLALSKNNYVKI